MLKNFLPLLISQLLFNGKMVTGELKFEDCVTKTFFKDKLQSIGIMSQLVTILKHDNYVITRDLSLLMKKMNLVPALAICLVTKISFKIIFPGFGLCDQ